MEILFDMLTHVEVFRYVKVIGLSIHYKNKAYFDGNLFDFCLNSHEKNHSDGNFNEQWLRQNTAGRINFLIGPSKFLTEKFDGLTVHQN